MISIKNTHRLVSVFLLCFQCYLSGNVIMIRYIKKTVISLHFTILYNIMY